MKTSPDHESETIIAKITTSSSTFIYKVFAKSHSKNSHLKLKDWAITKNKERKKERYTLGERMRESSSLYNKEKNKKEGKRREVWAYVGLAFLILQYKL